MKTHTPTTTKCFACNARMNGKNLFLAHTEDGQNVHIGEECHYKMQLAAGSLGQGAYQPPKGGPALFLGWIKK